MGKIGKIIKFDGKSIWFIEQGQTGEGKYPLADWIKPEYVKLGEAEITVDSNNVITFVAMTEDMANQNSKEKKSTTKKPKGWEDDIVSFEVLLTATHKKSGGNFSIKTECITVDLDKKYALFKATLSTSGKDGNVALSEFDGHGDATIENVTGDFIKPHFIRMAETRAIVRALRWYTNNGCAEEEK